MSEQRPEERPKRISLTVEWVGACSESDWIYHLLKVIEKSDHSRVTRVIATEALTDYGTTAEIPVARLRELGFKPLWGRDPWYVRWRLWWRR